MKVTLGKDGLKKTWQDDFPETTKCCRCNGESRIAFVAHEGIDKDDTPIWPRDNYQFVVDFHRDDDGCWPHDCISVAVYFCKECLEPTSLYNQA